VIYPPNGIIPFYGFSMLGECWAHLCFRSCFLPKFLALVKFNIKAWPHTHESHTKFVWIFSWVILSLGPATRSSDETRFRLNSLKFNLMFVFSCQIDDFVWFSRVCGQALRVFSLQHFVYNIIKIMAIATILVRIIMKS